RRTGHAFRHPGSRQRSRIFRRPRRGRSLRTAQVADGVFMRSRTATPFILVSSIFLSLIASALAQSKSGDAHKNPNHAARIAHVENGIPPIPLSGTEPPLQLNLE